jgi:hypothetical protein
MGSSTSSAFAAVAFTVSLSLGSTLFGGFFLFDFPAERFVFGVFGLAVFAFVVDFFDRDRFVVAFVVGRIGLPFVVRFFFAVFGSDEGRRSRDRGQRHGAS